MDNNSSTRREMLKSVVLAGAAVGLGMTTAGAAASEPKVARKRTLRFAHLTDIHVQPEKGADRGLAVCLHQVQGGVQGGQDPPSLIITGGDSVMDAFGADEGRTKLQWKLWHDVFRQECSTPVESCIGNHDVWGWDREKSGATGQEALYGKQWALEALGLPQRYRSFDRGGWHFVILDSVFFVAPADYVGALDDEQFAWLEADLARLAGRRPVCVVSHIPILSAAAFFDGENENEGNWKVPGSWMHLDARKIKDLFAKHPNVKLCLSGHLHLVDRVDYCGVAYLCNGAVCGGWWKGKNQEFSEGYGLIDLFDDGSFEHAYQTYPWTPVA